MTDWASLLRFDVDPLELVVRGTAVYWGLFLLFRFLLRRDTGALGIADILLLVLVADASQNAMAGGYQTVAEGALLVATIAAWSWLLDWAAFRSRVVRRFASPPPLVLVRRGRLLRRHLRQEHVTVPELLAALREQGIGKLAEVKMARMESDGTVSVIRQAPPADGDSGAGATGGGWPGAR